MITAPTLTREDLVDMATRILKRCPDLDDGELVWSAFDNQPVPRSAFGRDTIEEAIAQVRERRAKPQFEFAEAA